MSTCAPFHTQLTSIMEVLVNAAVAEISELVDEGYALLHLEISRSQKENHVLKEKLQLMEMRNAQGPGCVAFKRISGNHLTLRPAVNVNIESDRSSVGQDQDIINLCSDGEHSYKEESDPVMVSCISLNELMEKERVSPEPIHIKEERLEDELDTISPKGEVTISGEEHVKSGSDEDKRDINGHTETGHRIKDYDQDISANQDRKSTIQRLHLVTPSEHNVRKQRYPGNKSSMNEGHLSPKSGETDSEGSSVADVSSTYVTAYTKQQQMFVTDESVMDRLFSFESHNVKPEAVMLGPESCNEKSQSNRDASKETVHKENSISNKGSDYFGNLAERCLLNSGENTAEPKRALVHQYMSVSGHKVQHIIGKREKRYICRFCGKSFTCPKYLQSHQRVHTGEKPFSCSYCGKRFGQAGYLKKHQNVHTGEKPFGCLLCGKRFADSSNLIRHKSVHAGERPFICVQCGERFASKHNLRIHQKRNHSSHAVVSSPSIS